MAANDNTHQRERAPIILFAGTVSRRLFARSYRAALPLGWRWAPFLVLLVLVLAALPARAFEYFFRNPLSYLLHIPVGVLFFVGSIVAPHLLAYQAWRTDPAVKGHITGQAARAGMEWFSENASLKFPWEQVAGYIETKQAIILRLAGNRILIVPHQWFSTPEKLQEFRELISAEVAAA